jgi:transcriptional regulator with XRE-family HTH domain
MAATPEDFLRNARLAVGLSPEELAVAVGVGRQSIDRWEKRGDRPKKRSWGHLASALKITLAELVTGLGLDPSVTNVVPIRAALPVAIVTPEPDSAELERFWEVALHGCEVGHACHESWNAAMAATAGLKGIPWSPWAIDANAPSGSVEGGPPALPKSQTRPRQQSPGDGSPI